MKGITVEELIKKLNVRDSDQMVNIPNEIFKQLKVLSNKKDKKGSHITFAYSYIYLYTWLYRYCKYYNYPITTEEVKQLLGYSATNKTMNYLVKKNGLLEELNLLKTTTDYPVYYEFVDKSIQFETLSQQDEYLKEILRKRHSNNYTIKLPIFAFEREIEGEMDNGTFYDAYRTHIIDFNVFKFCMLNNELGCTAFYLYGYLKMNDYHYYGDFRATAKRISNETGIGEQTIIRHEKAMREYNMVELIHNMDYVSKTIDPNERIASTHKIKQFNEFTYEKCKVNKLLYRNVNDIAKEKQSFGFKMQQEELPF